MSEYRVDEAFGPVPLWLTESKVSDRAVRLYALLSGMRDYGTDMATVGRKQLAKKMRCSDDSLDRAKAELEKEGAITVERGERGEGGQIPRNVYTIHRTSPATRKDAATPIPAGVRVPDTRTGAAMYERKPLDEIPSSSNGAPAQRSGRAPTSLSGRKVTVDEETRAIEVLDAFNEISGRRFGSKEAVGKIIMRLREHPEVTVEAHREIIRAQFERPWWSGDASVGVVYGNGEVFDRALNGVRGGIDNDEGDDPHNFKRFD